MLKRLAPSSSPGQAPASQVPDALMLLEAARNFNEGMLHLLRGQWEGTWYKAVIDSQCKGGYNVRYLTTLGTKNGVRYEEVKIKGALVRVRVCVYHDVCVPPTCCPN